MRHEPSGSCLSLQPAADQRCHYRRAVQPVDGFHAEVGTPAGAASCQPRSAAVPRYRQQSPLGWVRSRAEAGFRALLAGYALQGGGDDAA
jgi:hypothetical protein